MSPYQRQRVSKTASPHPGEAGWIWIQQNRASLPNNHWVAARDDGVVALQRTIGELERELYQKQIDPAVVCIAFITSDAV